MEQKDVDLDLVLHVSRRGENLYLYLPDPICRVYEIHNRDSLEVSLQKRRRPNPSTIDDMDMKPLLHVNQRGANLYLFLPRDLCSFYEIREKDLIKTRLGRHFQWKPKEKESPGNKGFDEQLLIKAAKAYEKHAQATEGFNQVIMIHAAIQDQLWTQPKIHSYVREYFPELETEYFHNFRNNAREEGDSQFQRLEECLQKFGRILYNQRVEKPLSYKLDGEDREIQLPKAAAYVIMVDRGHIQHIKTFLEEEFTHIFKLTFYPRKW